MYPVSKHGFSQKNQIVAVAKRPFSRILHKPVQPDYAGVLHTYILGGNAWTSISRHQ
jgi:hypothetical protein